jgi:SAM-dependent MidA family methyltransferase
MTPAAALLRDEILRNGPIPFSRFMDAALYHPEHGYYRRARDPFGREGDFFTAEQVQPAFGMIAAARIRALWRDMGEPPDFTVVEIGPGRREMEEHFAAWRYIPVEIGDKLPERVRGVVFSNEFFDALPVEVVSIEEGGARRLLVGWNGDRFIWTPGSPERGDLMRDHHPGAAPGERKEIGLEALRWMERIASALEAGYVFTIDYGYTRRESARFPQGTLMSYRRHTALDDVLADPGERDITAHVHFTALAEHGARFGLEHVRLETLAQAILDVGEETVEGIARSYPLQLKTLLFGMGETFRVLLQRKS